MRSRDELERVGERFVWWVGLEASLGPSGWCGIGVKAWLELPQVVLGADPGNRVL